MTTWWFLFIFHQMLLLFRGLKLNISSCTIQLQLSWKYQVTVKCSYKVKGTWCPKEHQGVLGQFNSIHSSQNAIKYQSKQRAVQNCTGGSWGFSGNERPCKYRWFDCLPGGFNSTQFTPPAPATLYYLGKAYWQTVQMYNKVCLGFRYKKLLSQV